MDGPTKYERERTGRPRNPLALVVLSSDGQLTTLFKPAGQFFTHITTNLPRRSATEDLASSRITHGSMLSDAEGIHLVTHTTSMLPLTVNFYQIDLRFTPEVVFRCDATAILHNSTPLTGPGSVMTPSVVQHLQLLPQTSTRPLSVAVAVASREENASGEIIYRSQVAIWDVTPKLMGFHPAFQELSTRRNDAVSGQPSLAFVILGERRFENKFVSAMAFVPRSRELVVGFSDGSLLGLESRFSGPELLDATSTLLDGFHAEKNHHPVVAICPSPNGLALITSSLNGKISSIDTSESSGYDVDLDALIQCTILAILNEWDYSDIVSVVVRASKISTDDQLADRFVEGIFKSYDMIKGAEDSSMIEPFLPKASVMRRMLSLQLVLFQALPNKTVQYRVTCALLHLQSIGEVFSGCCNSDPAMLAAHLDQGSNAMTGQKPLGFDTNSLWSLLPLCGWVLDFCTVLFRELAVFLTMKSASSANTGVSTPTILCFLYHSRARKTLRSVLALMEQYYHFVRIREQLYHKVVQTGGAIEGPAGQGQGQGQEKGNHTNSMSIPEAVAMKDIQITSLSQYVEAAFTRCPLKVGVVKSMLRDLNGLSGSHVDPARANGAGALNRPAENEVLDKAASDHGVFIKGTIPSANSNALAQTRNELRGITRRYPTLWDMNRLMFVTIHWLDLEPANTLMAGKSGPRYKALAMHPSRCRIDPVAALKTRVPGPMSSGAGRLPYGLLHHQSSNGSIGNMPLGPRGSISSASGKSAMPSRVFTESPGEILVPQQGAHNGPLDLSNAPDFGPQSIWGIALDESDDETGDDRREDREDENERIKSVWHNWVGTLHGQQQHGPNGATRVSGNDDGAETVPDDDIILDESGEGEGEDSDEDPEWDEEMQDVHTSNGSRHESKGEIVRGRRSSLGATLGPGSQWLLQESRTISEKTSSEWTVFPVLSEERPCAGAEVDDSKGRMALLGLSGHFAPLDLQATEFRVHSQEEIEAQVRKRRFGVDPIRKVKKYKTTGNGRRCVRCLQISTNNSVNPRAVHRRVLPHQIGSSPSVIPDIAAATLWYHNYDRSCICGGMWLEL
ncbi:hypothetical protein BGZ54_010579 [Gamsiella multidivaricata]|nr:hypothetical protein BGZ54_010579 [Gamsiella multidivaricata]